MELLHRLNVDALLEVNGWARHTAWLHVPLVGFARYGVVLFAVLMVAGLVAARSGSSRRLAAAGWTPLAMLAALAINQPVGRWFTEPRPYLTHPHLLVLATRTSDFSFPSDHAVMAGAVCAGLLLYSRPLGLVGVAAAALLGFSRVYIGAHYPADVIAGLALGATVTLLGWLVLRRPLTAFTDRLRRQRPLRAAFAEA